MKFTILLLAALAAAAATTAANAAAPDTVQLRSEQVSALGIRLEQPTAGNRSLVVQASATAHEGTVLNDDGAGAGGLQDAADLDRGGQVHIASDLCTRAHEDV